MTGGAAVIASAWPCAGLWPVEASASGRRSTMEAVMSKLQPAAAKLSDAQFVILSAAAQRANGSLLPIPHGLSVKGAAFGKVVDTLCNQKFVEEKRVISGAPEWRRDEERRPLGLFITKAGLLALSIDEAEKAKPALAAASMPRQRKTGGAKSRRKAKKVSSASPKRHPAASQSKQDLVIQMLRRRSGVTVEEITTETGWQPHSVRGFFSGLVKKKLKLPLTSEVGKNGVRRYHIAPLTSAKA
jgi:hypothetical protein